MSAETKENVKPITLTPFIHSLVAAIWFGIPVATLAYFPALSSYTYDHRNESAVAVGGTIYLTGYDEEHGYELWKSDGTPSGTVLLKDLVPGVDSSDPAQFTAVGSSVYFIAKTSDPYRASLWKSDGTADGTVEVATGEFPTFPDFFPMVAWKKQIIFSRFYDDGPHFLWKSDGTVNGTTTLAELQFKSQLPYPPDNFFSHDFTAAGDLLYFIVGTSSSDEIQTLWRTDGTAKGTFRIGADRFVQPTLPVAFRDQLYFRAIDKRTGEPKLWKTTGTDAGTSRMSHFNFGTSNNHEWQDMIRMGPRVYLTFGEYDDMQLWRTNGERMEYLDSGARFQALGVYKGPFDKKPNLYFCNRDPLGYDHELWQTNGDRGNSHLFKELSRGYSGSFPTNFKAAGHRLFFSAGNNGDGANVLWTSLGTRKTTTRVKTFHQSIRLLGRIGSKQLFIVQGVNAASQLWITDGTSAGTQMLRDVPDI